LRYNPVMRLNHVSIIIFAALIAAACGGGGGSSSKSEPADAVYQQYFAKLTPAFTTLQQTLPTLDTSGNAPAAQLASNLRTYDDALNAFAATLDPINAPGQMNAPHKTLATQSKEIANAFSSIAARLALPSHTPTQNELTLTINASGSVVQWVAACQRLQAFGQTKGLTLDYKCGTTLGFGTIRN